MDGATQEKGGKGGCRFATRQLLIIHAHLLSAAGRGNRAERKRVRVGEGAAILTMVVRMLGFGVESF